jgi:DNA gyrase/topoisomerase IV subunit B
MYVGSTESPKTLVRELVDNATDEFLNAHANRIDIETDLVKGTYTVRDNGRGLPLYRVTEFNNQWAAKLLFTKLFSGAKFDHSAYKFSSGLHGVGLTVVNALSSER